MWRKGVSSLLASVMAATCILPGTAAGQALAPASLSPTRPNSVEDLTPEQRAATWREMQNDVYESGWGAVEQATRQAWGEPLDRDKAETVMKFIEAGIAGDWQETGVVATDALLGALPKGMSLYVELMKYTHGVARESIDSWAEELYDHPSYHRLGRLVEAEFRASYREFNSDIGLEDQPFLPSHRLVGLVAATQGDSVAGRREVARMRAVEGQLFELWSRGDLAAQEDAEDLGVGRGFRELAPGGRGVVGMFEEAYASRLRQVLGYDPTPRQIFNNFYLRITRAKMAAYIENYRRVRARQAAMEAIMARNDAIDAWLRLQPLEEPVKACPPSRLAQAPIGGGANHDASITSLQSLTDLARSTLAAEGISPSQIPLFPPNTPLGEIFVDTVQVQPAKLPAFEAGRFSGEIVLVLPPATTAAHFRGRPESLTGGLRTAEVPVGRAVGTVAQIYFNQRFAKMHLSRDGAAVAAEPLTIELIAPQYRYRYATGMVRMSMVSMLSLGVSVCVNGERVIDRIYESGETPERMSGFNLSESAHTGPHAVSLNNAIVKILEQATIDLAQTQGFETALTAAARRESARLERERLDREASERVAQALREQAVLAQAETQARTRAEAERAEAAAAAKPSPAALLKQLNEMLAEKLIDDEEFKNRQKQVLDAMIEGN